MSNLSIAIIVSSLSPPPPTDIIADMTKIQLYGKAYSNFSTKFIVYKIQILYYTLKSAR